MQISGIREAGANNILRWAMNNGASVCTDMNVISFINDETYYMLELTDVNFMELYHLSALYREKLRIVDEHMAAVPDKKTLSLLFPGTFYTDEDDKEGTPYAEIAEYVCQAFMNLALQMKSDSDIIESSVCKLYLPMICRTYTIQIPFSFYDLSQLVKDNSKLIFNRDYPNTLHEFVESNDFSTARNKLMLMMIKSTTITQHTKEYDNMLKIVKYGPLRKMPNNSLMKQKLISFRKYDPISRAEVRCDMFNITKDELSAKMKLMNRINSPLKIEFAIQVPFQYMFELYNTYPDTILPIRLETSIADTIETGIIMDNFVTMEFGEASDENKAEIEIYENAIKEYKVRIGECEETLINAIGDCMKSDSDIDRTAIFALLPSIFQTKAVIELNMEHLESYDVPEYANTYELIRQLIDDAIKLNNSVEDIKKS